MTATNLEVVNNDIEITEEVQDLIDEFDNNEDFIMEVIRYECNDVEEAAKALHERYHGEHECYKDFVWDLVNDCYFDNETPDILKNYFDYDSFGRDLQLGGDYYTIEVKWGEIHVFSGC